MFPLVTKKCLVVTKNQHFLNRSSVKICSLESESRKIWTNLPKAKVRPFNVKRAGLALSAPGATSKKVGSWRLMPYGNLNATEHGGQRRNPKLTPTIKTNPEFPPKWSTNVDPLFPAGRQVSDWSALISHLKCAAQFGEAFSLNTAQPRLNM